MKRNKGILLVGIFQNRRWVLGNFIRQVECRIESAKIFWVFSAYAKNKPSRIMPRFQLPRYEAYLFTYLSVFQAYLAKQPNEFANRSIVLYLHNEDQELGNLEEQAKILSRAHCVYFMSSIDAETLKSFGLNEKKIRLMFFAADDDCIEFKRTNTKANSVLLASKYGPRKGLELLPKIIESLPDWTFNATGDKWKDFISKERLYSKSNFNYEKFSTSRKIEIYSKSNIFLSLSNLEGGPVPLLETMAMGLVPVATSTGFAGDLIVNGKNGFLIRVKPAVEEVIEALKLANSIGTHDLSNIHQLSWKRIIAMLESSVNEILNE